MTPVTEEPMFSHGVFHVSDKSTLEDLKETFAIIESFVLHMQPGDSLCIEKIV